MRICNLLLMLAIAAGNGAAYAASPGGDGTKHSHEAGAAAKHEGFGIVKEINTVDGKVKIAHEPIPALKWPGMTMWFALHGPLAPEIRAGDSVRFELQQAKTGEWVIIRIEHKR